MLVEYLQMKSRMLKMHRELEDLQLLTMAQSKAIEMLWGEDETKMNMLPQIVSDIKEALE